MANADRVKGLQPYGRVLSIGYYLAGGTIYQGDPCKFNSDGKVVVATAGDACMGVALQYGASGDRIAIADSPSQKYEAQCDDSTVDAQTDINLNADFVFGSADTTYRRSGVEVDASTVATTATLQAKILEVVPRADNALGEFCKVIVKINNHQLGSHTGTAGV